MSYYNVGIQYEFFQKYDTSAINYEKAYNICEQYLGIENTLTKRFLALYQKFNDKFGKKI